MGRSARLPSGPHPTDRLGLVVALIFVVVFRLRSDRAAHDAEEVGLVDQVDDVSLLQTPLVSTGAYASDSWKTRRSRSSMRGLVEG